VAANCRLRGLGTELYLREVMHVLPQRRREHVIELCPRDWARTDSRLVESELEREVGAIIVPRTTKYIVSACWGIRARAKGADAARRMKRRPFTKRVHWRTATLVGTNTRNPGIIRGQQIGERMRNSLARSCPRVVEKIDRGRSMSKWWRVEVRERVVRQHLAKITRVRRVAGCALALLAVVALGSCGSSSRGVIPTPDGGVRPVRSPYCEMFTGGNTVYTDSNTVSLCSPEMAEGAPCRTITGQTYLCTSLAHWSPDLAEYYATNRVPRLCARNTTREAEVPCVGDVGGGCGSGSVCVPGLRGASFPLCVPLPCNNN
jgi:hypothetical protein